MACKCPGGRGKRGRGRAGREMEGGGKGTEGRDGGRGKAGKLDFSKGDRIFLTCPSVCVCSRV